MRGQLLASSASALTAIALIACSAGRVTPSMFDTDAAPFADAAESGNVAGQCFGVELPVPACSLVGARPFDVSLRCLGPTMQVGPLCYSCLDVFPPNPVNFVCGFDPTGALFVVPKPNELDVRAPGWHFRSVSSILPDGGDGSEEQRACDDAYAAHALTVAADAGTCVDGGDPRDARADVVGE